MEAVSLASQHFAAGLQGCGGVVCQRLTAGDSCAGRTPTLHRVDGSSFFQYWALRSGCGYRHEGRKGQRRSQLIGKVALQHCVRSTGVHAHRQASHSSAQQVGLPEQAVSLRKLYRGSRRICPPLSVPFSTTRASIRAVSATQVATEEVPQSTTKGNPSFEEELSLLLSLLPEAMRKVIEGHPEIDGLVEIVLDLGRKPMVRFPSGDVFISEDGVTAEDIELAVSKVSCRFGTEDCI